ncbi:MAG: dihydroorotase [Bacteroidia bacterium]
MPKTYLIRNATLIQEGNPLHGKSIDILISKGKIQEIGPELKAEASVIAGQDLWVTEGWVDMRCHLTDPGNEHKDTLENTLNTAAAGGFTSLVTLPHSEPCIRDKSGVNYIVKSSQNHLVDVQPTGVLSDTKHAENLAELYDMSLAGAVAFTNGDGAVSNGLLKKALLYTKPFGAKVITHPSDKSIEQGGTVNESETTVHTGLKTSPSIAEFISVREQIEVARYCDAAVHFSCVSTAESVDHIRQAKKEGLAVTCDVSIFNLCFTDKEVLSFDENFKLYPPLRSEKDRKALVKGVNDGVIDAICSNHNPQNIESKQVEFDYADTGALSLQLVLPWYLRHLANDIAKETFVNALTNGPRKVLGLSTETISKGASANLTIVDTHHEWIFNAETNHSSSKNTHEWKQEQKGRIVSVFNNKETYSI